MLSAEENVHQSSKASSRYLGARVQHITPHGVVNCLPCSLGKCFSQYGAFTYH